MLMGRCIMSYVSWAPHGTVAVPGVMPRLTMREKMAPLYGRNAAAAAARKGTAKNNSVISVSSRSFYVRGANLPLPQPRDEARKLGTALCKTPMSASKDTQQRPEPNPRARATSWTITE